ncbi:MAG: hypothetical protein CMJ19_02160 [Phycisphaeraceae bacterium]|nr:hypothetical protein [Phycisphaeraceae bacterium]
MLHRSCVIRLLFVLMAWVSTTQASELKSEIDLHVGKDVVLPISDALYHSDQVYLKFSARVDSQGRYASGSTQGLLVYVNNVPVDIHKLVNKRHFYIFNKVNKVNWYWGSNGWSVTYYPWGKANDVPGGQVHDYVFDIKSLLKESGNQLRFSSVFNSVKDAYFQIKHVQVLENETFEKSPLLNDTVVSESHGLYRYRELATGYHEGVNRKLDTVIDYQSTTEIKVSPTQSYVQQFDYVLNDDGMLAVTVNGETYEFTSSFRVPNSDWSDIELKSVSSSWELTKGGTNRLTYQHEKLKVVRTIQNKGSHLLVSDALTNQTLHDLPVVLMNMMDFKKLDELQEFRIAGNKQSMFYADTSTMESREFGATPVVYVERKNSGMGVVIEDDVYRNHASYLAWGDCLGIGDDLLYLKPKRSYTVQWKIYPVAQKDYYQLVNSIRRDWGFNRQIPGLFGFVHPSSDKPYMYKDLLYKTPKEIAGFIESTGMNVPSTLAMLPKNGKPFGMTGNESIEQLREGIQDFIDWRDKARKGGAKIHALPYLDVHLVKPYFDGSLDNVAKRLPGSLIKNAYDEYVPYNTGEQYLVLPALNNACGQHLLRVLKLWLDEQDFDGLYLDEWDHSRARVSFNHHDGYSALLDRDGKLVRKVGFVPLLTRDFQKRYVDEVTQRGKMVFANQFDHTRVAAELPVIHFAEPLGSYDYKLFAAQLTATPLSLHVARSRSIWTDVKEFLKRGVLMCYYFKYFEGDHILKKIYPITVDEVWPGYVVGQHKMVTLHSGSYTFNRSTPLVGYVYAGPKAQCVRTVQSQSQADGISQVTLTLTEDEVAVIVEAK